MSKKAEYNQPSFLDLPYDIRFLIYEAILQPHRYKQLDIHVELPLHNRLLGPPQDQIKLLQLCKQTYEEAYVILKRKPLYLGTFSIPRGPKWRQENFLRAFGGSQPVYQEWSCSDIPLKIISRLQHVSINFNRLDKVSTAKSILRQCEDLKTLRIEPNPWYKRRRYGNTSRKFAQSVMSLAGYRVKQISIVFAGKVDIEELPSDPLPVRTPEEWREWNRRVDVASAAFYELRQAIKDGRRSVSTVSVIENAKVAMTALFEGY
ncbi:MAG: hypothetical protein Q9227_006592 [Pyrenula ochraceoflavens]